MRTAAVLKNSFCNITRSSPHDLKTQDGPEIKHLSQQAQALKRSISRLKNLPPEKLTPLHTEAIDKLRIGACQIDALVHLRRSFERLSTSLRQMLEPEFGPHGIDSRRAEDFARFTASIVDTLVASSHGTINLIHLRELAIQHELVSDKNRPAVDWILRILRDRHSVIQNHPSDRSVFELGQEGAKLAFDVGLIVPPHKLVQIFRVIGTGRMLGSLLQKGADSLKDGIGDLSHTGIPFGEVENAAMSAAQQVHSTLRALEVSTIGIGPYAKLITARLCNKPMLNHLSPFQRAHFGSYVVALVHAAMRNPDRTIEASGVRKIAQEHKIIIPGPKTPIDWILRSLVSYGVIEKLESKGYQLASRYWEEGLAHNLLSASEKSLLITESNGQENEAKAAI